MVNTNDSGTGSLRTAIEASGSRIAWIQTDGVLEAQTRLTVANGDLTIWNDSHNFTIKNNGLYIAANNVIVRGLRIWPGENTQTPSTSNALRVASNITDVVVDHCSLMLAVDQNLNIDGDAITVRDSIIALALSNSIHSEGEHSKGVLVDEGESITMLRCYLAHNLARNPLLNQGILQMLNCVVYNTGGTPVSLFPVTGDIVAWLEGNTFKAGANNTDLNDWFVQHVSSNFSVTGYLSDNDTPTATPEDPTLAAHPTNRESFGTTPLEGFPAVSTMVATDALAYVLANAGPPVRHALEQQVIDDYEAGTGQVIDHPSDVGLSGYDA